MGGRLDKANIPFAVKQSVVLPKNSHVTKLVIHDYHERVGHAGLSHTWATTRQKFWIIKGAATVRKVLGQCLLCKRRNARAGQQIMSDLPNSRLAANKPPFYFTGEDYFGPMFVKQGRAMVKRWGCLFTCMTVRASPCKNCIPVHSSYQFPSCIRSSIQLDELLWIVTDCS